MTTEMIVSIGREALILTVMVAGPMLAFGLVIGLVISIFQAVTQINEMTLTFVPKLIAVITTVAFALPWMNNILLQYTRELWSMMSSL